MNVAFITGAGSGIGRATAIRLSNAGYALSLFDRDGDALRSTVAELADASTPPLTFVGDVTQPEHLKDAVEATVEKFGGLDACAACAGIETMGGLSETSHEQWERVLAVNLMGVVNTAKAVVSSLIAAENGAFVAIGSDAGTNGFSEWSAYCASKHAVIGLVRAMAVELGPLGVRSNVVAPCMVETPMAARIFSGSGEDERAAVRDGIPLKRFARPEEVANAVCHLLSDEATFTNGLVYAIDGGETAGFVYS